MFDPFRKIVGIKTKAEEQREREQRERAQRAERERRDREQLAKVEREKREKEQREQAERERKQREAVAQAERERKQREAVAQAERERKQREAVAQAKRERTQREAGEKAERERKQARATGINPDAVSTLSENSGVVTLAVLPNGLLASGSNDRTIKVWNIERGACEATLSGHTGFLNALVVLPNGWLASGSDDTTIKVWNVARRACEATLSGHTKSVTALAMLPNGRLASGSEDKTIKVWNIERGACEATLSGHTERVIALGVLPNGRLASGSADRTIKVWNIERGACETTLSGYGGRSLAVLPNGRLASGSDDNQAITVWNVERGTCEATLSGHTGFLHALVVLPNGWLASGSADKTIKVWNIERGACEATLSGHTSYVFSLAVLPNGMLVSGADGKTIKVWDLGMHERLVQEKKLREEKERQERLAREQKIREEKERQEQLAREQKIREEKERQDNAERLRLEQEIIIKQVTRLSQPLAADRADAARILAGLALKTEHRMRIGQTSVISQLLDLLRDEDMDVKKHVAIVLSRLSINTNDLHKAIDAGIVSLLKGSSEAAAQNILRQIQSILDERYRADAPVLDKLKEHVINNEWRKFQVALSSLKYRDHRLNTSEGDTLLHLAIRHDRVAMVLELLKKDWHTTILNTLEQTSFDLARSLRNPVLLYVLKEIKSSEEVLTTVTRYIDEQSCSQLLFIRAEVNFELSKTVDLLPQKEGYLRNGLRDIERILRTEPSYTDASVLCERISHELDALALAKEAQKEEQRIKREHEIRQKTDGLELELSNLRCEWDAGNPRSLLERYQELLKQHAKNGALYRETGEFYAFQSNKAGVLIQKKGLYEKALNHFRKAIELDDFDFEAAQLYGTAMESLKALNISEKKAEPVAPSSKITDKRIDDLTEDQKKRLEVMKERRKAELLAQRDAAVGLSHACMFGVQGPSSASASDALSLRKN